MYYDETTLKENLDYIDEIKGFKKGWDGEDAYPISDEVLNIINDILLELKLQPDICPLEDGGILFDFPTDDKTHLSVELYTQKLIYCFIKSANYDDAETGTIVDRLKFKQSVLSLVEKFINYCTNIK